jgi:hypothetical protein
MLWSRLKVKTPLIRLDRGVLQSKESVDKILFR